MKSLSEKIRKKAIKKTARLLRKEHAFSKEEALEEATKYLDSIKSGNWDPEDLLSVSNWALEISVEKLLATCIIDK